MPRKPIGERPMTDAERQARCRAARESGTPAVRIRRPLDHRSRAKRWRDAVSELTTLQGHYAAWLEALPENLQDSATAEALHAICDLDLTELQAIVPPAASAETDPRRPLGTRAGASRTAPDRPTSPAPHRTALPRLRNPDQLRRGERYRPRHSQGGSILDADLECAPGSGQIGQ